MEQTLFPPLSRTHHQDLRALQRRREREERQLFLAEGEHLCEEALRENVAVDCVVVASDVGSSALTLAETFARRGCTVLQTSPQKFLTLCDAVTPQKILAVVRFPEIPILPDKPLIVLDGISDPGNVGTIIRTADWFGFRHILLSADCADRFHPKVIRASMGSVFRCALRVTGSLATTLRQQFPDHQIVGAAANSETPLARLVLPDLYAIVLGSEARGISAEVLSCLHQSFAIEGAQTAESLNVGIAAGIIVHHCFSIAQKTTTM